MLIEGESEQITGSVLYTPPHKWGGAGGGAADVIPLP